MNTPMWLDIYLIQNCKAGFVLDRMRDVYGEEEYLMMQVVDLTAEPPEDLQKGRKIRVRPTDRTRFPLHSKPYDKGDAGGYSALIWTSGTMTRPAGGWGRTHRILTIPIRPLSLPSRPW